MHIGFTGSSEKVTQEQIASLRKLFTKVKNENKEKPTYLHHGVCIGADAIAHLLFLNTLGDTIIKHPPTNTKKMSMRCNEGVSREPKDYMTRNQDIVNESEWLIAVPKEETKNSYDIIRSGTWSTVRRAQKANKKVFLVLPSGKVSQV